MTEFPLSPMAPNEFFEEWLPRAFAEADLPEEAGEVDVKLGILLLGEGGGEWVFHLEGGRMSVRSAPRAEAALTVAQSVEDWRGAIWEGRGGAIGKHASAFFRPGFRRSATPAGPRLGPPSARALAALEALDGVIRLVVTGGEGGDWRVDLKLGQGAIPEEPTTTIAIASEDSAAIERGELDLMQALMTGRIQVTGDVSLVLQMQSIQMQAAQGPPPAQGS